MTTLTAPFTSHALPRDYAYGSASARPTAAQQKGAGKKVLSTARQWNTHRTRLLIVRHRRVAKQENRATMEFGQSSFGGNLGTIFLPLLTRHKTPSRHNICCVLPLLQCSRKRPWRNKVNEKGVERDVSACEVKTTHHNKNMFSTWQRTTRTKKKTFLHDSVDFLF